MKRSKTIRFLSTYFHLAHFAPLYSKLAELTVLSKMAPGTLIFLIAILRQHLHAVLDYKKQSDKKQR